MEWRSWWQEAAVSGVGAATLRYLFRRRSTALPIDRRFMRWLNASYRLALKEDGDEAAAQEMAGLREDVTRYLIDMEHLRTEVNRLTLDIRALRTENERLTTENRELRTERRHRPGPDAAPSTDSDSGSARRVTATGTAKTPRPKRRTRPFTK
jgi:regulator of replication initiation timing